VPGGKSTLIEPGLRRPLAACAPSVGRVASTRARVVVCCALLLLVGSQGILANGASIEDDLFLGVWSPFRTRWVAEVPVCVWSGDGAAQYQVAASGLASPDQFALTNDVDDQVSYAVIWRPGARGGRRERLNPGVLSTGTYPFSLTEQCTDGPSARLKVRVNRRAINRAPTGIYNDTILLTIVPL